MKDIKNYIDKWGMVVTLQGDGGDSCSHGCAMLYSETIVGNDNLEYPYTIPTTYVRDLEQSSGRFVRHPDPTKWYSKINTFSRDQLTPLLASLGLLQFNITLRRLFLAHLKRGLFFAWNTRMNGTYPGMALYAWKLPDLTGPEIWAMWIRAFRAYPLYPLLFLFDIQTLIGSIQYKYFSTSTIQMNQVIVTDFATRIMPTPTSMLARWIYGKKTPIDALNKNWGDATPFNPPVNQYLVPVVTGWKTRE